jgi:non-canonical purine NTP pyrophosphatase (RdgB/HAM1 family)
MGGLPGALVKWFLLAVGPAGICAMVPELANPTATARTAVALCDGGTVEVFTGETRGVIVEEPTGEGGFGWDAIFRPDGSPRTFAEMDAAERAVYSMRRQAFERLRDSM